ncbi:MAG: hypothetical protein NVSMB56_18670 [Pyrinomonadaceae bacterium]
MEGVKTMLRVVGIVLLGLFVLIIGVPLVFAAAGITLMGIFKLVGLAIFLIKIAVVVALCYLILVAVRAVMNR